MDSLSSKSYYQQRTSQYVVQLPKKFSKLYIDKQPQFQIVSKMRESKWDGKITRFYWLDRAVCNAWFNLVAHIAMQSFHSVNTKHFKHSFSSYIDRREFQ